MILVSENVSGNLHTATEYLNLQGWGDYVLALHPVGPAVTIVVLRVPVRHPLAVAYATRTAAHQPRSSMVDVPAWRDVVVDELTDEVPPDLLTCVARAEELNAELMSGLREALEPSDAPSESPEV